MKSNINQRAWTLVSAGKLRDKQDNFSLNKTRFKLKFKITQRLALKHKIWLKNYFNKFLYHFEFGLQITCLTLAV